MSKSSERNIQILIPIFLVFTHGSSKNKCHLVNRMERLFQICIIHTDILVAATEYHLGLLKAKLAKYRSQLLEPTGKAGAKVKSTVRGVSFV